MRLRLSKLNAEWRQSGLARIWQDRGIPEISIRLGVHSGAVVAGNLGSQTRMKDSVIGDSFPAACRTLRCITALTR
jgi:class 3 adenylate cyclase